MNLSVLHVVLSLGLAEPAPEYALERIAENITFAAEISDGAPFRGEARKEASALALVAIAAHESGFRERVILCRETGDRLPHHRPAEGRSVSAWQLMRGYAWAGFKRHEICGTGPIAPWLALRVLRHHGTRCTKVLSWFRGYATGDCGKRADAAARQCELFERIAKRNGIAVSCAGSGEAAWADRESVRLGVNEENKPKP